jgi:hypothetical protein
MGKPKTITQEMAPFTLRAAFDPASFDEEKRTVDIVWTTGARVLQYDWMRDEYFYEDLSLDPAHMRMKRFDGENGVSFLNNHWKYDLNSVLGRAMNPKIDGKEGRATVRFSRRPAVDDIVRDVKDKILTDVSVGYRVYKYEDMGFPQDSKYRVRKAVDWEPIEVSLVTIGADDGCGTRSDRMAVRSAEVEKNPCEIILSAESANPHEKERSMTPEQTKAAPEGANTKTDGGEGQRSTAPDEKALQAARDEGQQAERKRCEEIERICRAAKIGDDFAKKLTSDTKVTVEQARALVIDELAKKDQETQIRRENRVTIGQDETVMRRTGAEIALLHRAHPGVVDLTEHAREFRNMSLIRLAEDFVGPSARSMNPNEICSRALTSSDFPLLLGNVAEKMLMNAYKVLQKTYEKFVTPGELKDYKPAYRYQVGDSPALLPVNEDGEYKLGKFGEKAESILLADWGRLLLFTRKMIINDDLAAFVRVINGFAGSAARLVSKMVYTDTLMGNPKMGDGVALFHATHGNLGGASAINEAGLSAMEQLIMNQKTLDNEDFLNIVAKYLIVGTAKKVEAQKMLHAVVSTKSTDVNPYQDAYELIVEPRVTGNTWFMACSPSDIPTIEVATMVGENGPVVDSKEEFNSDGLKVKCRHTVAVKALEWKGFAYNPGA